MEAQPEAGAGGLGPKLDGRAERASHVCGDLASHVWKRQWLDVDRPVAATPYFMQAGPGVCAQIRLSMRTLRLWTQVCSSRRFFPLLFVEQLAAALCEAVVLQSDNKARGHNMP